MNLNTRKEERNIFQIRLKNLREKAGYSQYSFADAFGVAQSTVGNWEAGKREPNFDTIQRLAAFFGVTVDYLLGITDYPHPLPDNAKAFDLGLVPYDVIGTISVGYDGEAIEEYTGETEYVSSEVLNGHKKDDYFVLNVRGNSMYPEFKEGDRVVVQRCASVDSETVAVVLYTGCRRGELLALEWSDIDLCNRTITINKSTYNQGSKTFVKKPKTEAGNRTVPLLDKLYDKITPAEGLVFPGKDGYMTEKQFRMKWGAYVKESGVTCTPHQLRHAYATMLFENDIAPMDAQELLGHANIQTTNDIYTHIRDTRRKK